MKYVKLICLLLSFLTLASCMSSAEFAQYLDEKHDVIVYDGYEYHLADGYDISSRSFDNPSGNSVKLIDHDEKKPGWRHDFFGESVFYTKNKTVLGWPGTSNKFFPCYIREDKYDEYIELLNVAIPPVFYLRANILRYATEESSSYREPLYKVDDELYEVFADAVYAPDEVMSYSEYSDKGKRIIEAGILHGGVTDGEFYYALCPFYYNHEFGFGIAVGEGDDMMIHLIPREYDEMIRESFYSEDGRFKTESAASDDTQ